MIFRFKDGNRVVTIGRPGGDAGGSVERPLDIEVLPLEECARQCDAVICVSAETITPFKDDAFGTCVDCGCPIRFRPYTPATLPKICITCFVKRTQA